MALQAPNTNQQQQQATNPNMPVVSPTPSTGGAGGAGASGGAKGTANVPGVNTPAQPSASLAAYLQANAPQATTLANQIAPSLTNQITNANNQISQAEANYQAGLNNVATNQNVLNEVTNAPASLNATDQSTYQQMVNAQTTAPSIANTFETSSYYQPLSTAVQNVQQNTALWNNAANVPTITAALSPFETAGTTTGNMTLDALLLGETPSAYNTISQAIAPAATLPTTLNTATTASDQALQNTIAQDTAATQAATAAGNQYVTNLTNTLNQTVATAQAAAAQGNTTLLNDLMNQSLTPTDEAALGITNTQWQQLQAQLNLAQNPQTVISNGAAQYQGQTPTTPVNLATYLTQLNPQGSITAANVATPDQYANLAALQQLMGNAAPGNVPLQASNASLASTAPANLNSFNYNSALTGTQQTAQTAKAMEQAYVNAIQAGSDQSHALAAAQNVAENQALAGEVTVGASGAVGGALAGGALAGAAGADTAASLGMIGAGGLAGAPETLGISLVAAAVAMLVVALVPGAAQWIGRNEGAIANGFEDFGNDIVSFFSGW